MKRARVLTLTAVLVTAAAVTFSSGAGAPSPTPGADTVDVVADSPECGKQVGQRQGAWFCTDPEASKQMAEKVAADAKAAGASTEAVATTTSGDGVTGWCNTVGDCWYLYDINWNKRAPYVISEATATGAYGYGSKTLGTVSVDVIDKYLRPNQMRIYRQRFTSTRAVRSAYWSTYTYLVDAANPYGKVCGDNNTMASVSKAALNPVTFDGFDFRPDDCRAPVQAIYHRIYWRDPDPGHYPGRWKVWLKSAKYYYYVGSQGTFQGDWDTPLGPAGAGGGGWENV